MNNPRPKWIALVLALFIVTLGSFFYLSARPLAPSPTPSSLSVAPAPVAPTTPVVPAPSPVPEPPSTISWNPTSITDSLFLGTVKSEKVTFTSNTNLKDLSLRVSRKLRPYVSVSPDHLSNVSVGSTTTVTIFLAASPNQPIGTFRGNIRVRTNANSPAEAEGDSVDGEDVKGEAKPLHVSLTVSRDTTPPVLSILSPANNSTVSSSAIVVTGTVQDETPVAINVNGIPAEVNGNRFVANGVRLRSGSNIITAQATDVAGNRSQSSISVQGQSLFQPFRLSVFPPSGIAPLDVTFSVVPFLAKPVAVMDVDFDGDGSIDFSSPGSFAATHTYQSEGVYPTRVTLKDTDGNPFSEDFFVNVYPQPPLKEIWVAMRAALLRNDINTALFYFADQSKEQYQKVFEALGTNLSTIAARLPDASQLELSYIRENTADFTFPLSVQQGGSEKQISHDLLFRRDVLGFWKIDAF